MDFVVWSCNPIGTVRGGHCITAFGVNSCWKLRRNSQTNGEIEAKLIHTQLAFKVKVNVNGGGQECPLHRRKLDCATKSGEASGRLIGT